MATLYFVRHGKTTMNKERRWSGRTDCDLLPESKEELKKAFAEYTSSDFDVYFCSPLKRTQQTLDAIIPGQIPIIDDRIIERDYGDWEGKPYSIIDDETTELFIQGKVQPQNGETYDETQKRVISFVSEMFSKYKNDEKILVVSHASVLRMVRDVFLPEMEKSPIKNSQMIIINDSDFQKAVL